MADIGNSEITKQKIILITDFGGDVDDAHALHMVLYYWSEQLDLLGVVTTDGLPDLRTRMVQWFLDKAGCNAPVHGGCRRPLGTSGCHIGTPAMHFNLEGSGMFADAAQMREKETDPEYSTDPQQFHSRWGAYNALPSGSYIDSDFAGEVENILQHFRESGISPNTGAANFIADTVYQYPGAVKIVVIGALTDVAIALHLYPDLKDQIQECVFMGMVQQHTISGFGMNMRQDMVAAAVVAASGVRLTCVTSNITRPLQYCPRSRPLIPVLTALADSEELDWADLEEFDQPGEVTEVLQTLTEIWFRRFGWLGLADPLTVGVALDPGKWGTYRRGTFHVYLDGNLGNDFSEDELGPHCALETVDIDAFEQAFTQAFTQYWHI